MRKTQKLLALCITIIAAMTAASAAALDYPHFGINNIGCDSCHFIYGSQPSLLPPWTVQTPVDIDDTPFNTLCWSCHNDIEAPFVRTHSSLQIDNGYGNWTIECRVCHNPHYQQQFKIYGSASYLYSGAVTGVSSATITMAGAGWTVDQYKNRVVFPNVLQKNYSYKILSNTSDTLTVQGPVDLTKVSVGNTCEIIYGKLIKETIVTPNSGSKATRFFRSTGAKSFADGDSVYDGVCEVCHTKTTYHRNNPAADHAHNTGTKCTGCHFHSEGFKGSCTACHGSPPVDAATLVFNPGPTGSLTAGAHNLHANVKGFGCSVCHYNSAGAGATHNNGSVTIGFYSLNGTYQGGIYNGQAGVSYSATGTSPATTVNSGGSATCSNIYCHSSGQSTSNGSSAIPEYGTPKWDNPASGSCGTCHRVTEASGLTSGSHGQHLGTTGVSGCGDCHTGASNDASSYNSASHINGSINVANTYSAGGAPGNGYGTCSTAPCHDNGTGSPALTPVWGADVPACTACHAEIPGTGSHQKHVVTTGYNKAGCSDCHNAAVQGTVPPVQHLDTNIDVYYATPGDLGYPQNKAKGSAYASCSTAYCHSTGQSVTNGNSAIPSYATPQWGNPASGACGTCHKVTEASGLTSGSHAQHLGTVGVSGCGDCHIGAANNASSYNSITHIDGIIDVANTYSAGGAPGNGNGTCSTASCHDNGTGSPAITPVWGTSAPACTACHALIPATGSHQRHVVTTSFNKAVCGDCHDGAVQGVTPPEQHLDSNVDVYDVSPGDLGYPQNKSKASLYVSCSTAYCHSSGQSVTNGNSAIPSYATPEWGNPVSGACGTCHKISAVSGLTSGSHAVHLNASGVNGCGDCHTGAANNASSYNSLNHVNKQIDVANTYSAAGSPGNGYGTCSTASCHTNVQTDGGGPGSLVPTPVWGSSIACGECHQAVPTTGKHTVHLVNAGAVCGDCHNGAGNGSSIPSANHINGVINVGGGSTQIGSYSSPGIGDGYGTCSNITCHGNNNANWAASTSTVTLDCSNCHGGTSDVDDFIYLNGTASKVNMSQWYSTGHGGIQTPLACTTCHTASVPHGTENNFFRLGNGVRDICTVCHKGMTEHFGYRHNEHNGLNGGSLCWDCHDPHGDTSIKMIHDKPWLSHDSGLRPVKVADTVVTFSANSAWNDFVKPGPDYNGVCQVCHESSTNIQHFYRYDTYPNVAGNYDTGHNPGAVCTACHQHNDFQPTACNGCHGQSGETGAPLIASDLVTKSGRGVGAHQKHVIDKGYTDCTLCHSGYIMPQAVPEMTITFTGLGTGGMYDGMAFTGSDINWSYDPAWPTTTGTRDCSNLYCHGNFSGSGKNATPSWDIPSSGACGTCHGQSNFDPPMSGKHVRHADSYKFECFLCHKGVVDLDRVFYGMNYFKVIDNVKHVNGVVDWAFDLTDPRFPAGAAYSIPSGTAVPTDGTTPRESGNCSNIYCHSIVQTSVGGVLTPGTSDYKSPSWSNNSNWLGCNGCHENKNGNHGYTGNGLKSGSHASHLQYNFTTGNSDRLICAVCHKTGPNGFYSNTCGACHTGFPTLSHADGKIDVIMASEVVGNSAAYHGTPQPADGFSNCTNVYCHSTGQSVTDGNSAVPVYTVPTWGSPSSGACGTCHRVSESSGLTSGSHAEHLGATGVNGCGDCHQGAANDGSSYNDYVKHVNKSVDVSNDYSAGGAPGNGYGTCSAASCHTTVQADGGTAGTLKTTPVWGTATACGECHEAVPTTGRHTVHLINASATCGNCHPGAGNGSAIPSANHINGVINIGGASTEIGSYSSPGIGDGYGTCSSISCHGGNSAVWVKKTEPASLDCADCHGGTSDVDDFNYLNGTTAKISMSEWSAKGHGSKSLTCTSCHDTAVPHGDSNNFYRLKGGNSTICQTCHTNLTQHYGDRHSTAYNGGSFCFDCHDPHGDASVKMIHDRPWLSHDASGKPTKVADTNVSFTGNQGWSDFVKSGFNGVCQICHESATGIKHFYRYSTYPTVAGSYNTNHNQGFACTQCHKHNDFKPAGGCTICHSVTQGSRAAVVGQLSSGNSHHIQGVELKDEHCYQCHWEANSDGSINYTYHGGWDYPGSTINLVIYGNGSRPVSYTAGTTAVEYTAGAADTPPAASTPITVVNAWTSLSTSGSGSSRTASFTAGSGTNRMVIIGMAWESGSSCNPSSITGNYGGQALTAIKKAVASTNQQGQWMGYIGEAGIAARSNNTVTLTFNGCTPDRSPTMSAATYQNVSQSTAPSSVTASGTSGSSFSWSGLPVVAKGYAMYNVSADGISSFAPPSGYTERYDSSTSDFRITGGDKAINTGGTESGSVTGNTSSSRWALVAVSLSPAGSSGSSTREAEKLNAHCLGCHRAQNNNIQPFGDGKTPKQYAWDGLSIDERYSQTGTTPWGKYTNTSGTDFTPKNTQTKAYSAHGNAVANQRGWNLSETWPNTSGAIKVLCFDCHNSHGSTVSGKTSSYTSATTNGAILKDTTAGKGGFTMTYKPQAGGSSADGNAHNAGAAICFDCHTTQSAGTTPWGYQGTFGSSQAILGYFDTMRFGPGLAGPQQRYAYKAQNAQAKKGHFGVSASLSMPVNGTIGGLCTPCHDPHGVSPSLGANQQYSVPLLKGTWITSPYKEDSAPATTNERRGTVKKDPNKPAFTGASIPGYKIDQNTFSNWNFTSTSSVSQSVNEFGGLCLSCHPKSSLSPDTTSAWKSVDRIHNSVKGWDNDGNTQHRFTCSKCHTPHNAALGRLLITDCLDSSHRGRVASGGRAVKFKLYGEKGLGNGGHPAGGGGSKDGGSGEIGKERFQYWFGSFSGGRQCHDTTNSDSFPLNQRWNNVSDWGQLGPDPGPLGCADFTTSTTCQNNRDRFSPYQCEWKDNVCRTKD